MFKDRFTYWFNSVKNTPKQLAEITEIKESTIYNVLSGKTESPGVDFLEKLADKIDNMTPELLWEIVTERPIPQDNRTNDLKREIEDLKRDKDRLYSIIENFFTLK